MKQHNYLRERVLIKKRRHHNQSDGLIYKRVCRYFPCYMNTPPLSSRKLSPRTEKYHAFKVFTCFQNSIMLSFPFSVSRTESCFWGLSLFTEQYHAFEVFPCFSVVQQDWFHFLKRFPEWRMLCCDGLSRWNFISYGRFSMRIKYGSSILGMDVEVFY